MHLSYPHRCFAPHLWFESPASRCGHLWISHPVPSICPLIPCLLACPLPLLVPTLIHPTHAPLQGQVTSQTLLHKVSYLQQLWLRSYSSAIRHGSPHRVLGNPVE